MKQSRVAGGSGMRSVRNFCADSGSMLFGTPESAPDMVTIYAGTLDAAATYAPTAAIFASQRPPWARLAMPLEEYPGHPGQ